MPVCTTCKRDVPYPCNGNGSAWQQIGVWDALCRYDPAQAQHERADAPAATGSAS